jgi:hypothetical protein
MKINANESFDWCGCQSFSPLFVFANDTPDAIHKILYAKKDL